jgi:hypothetical protein
MVVLAPHRFVQLLAAAWALVACSSAPDLKREVTVVGGQLTVVRYLQLGSSLALSLRNVSAQAPTAVYGTNSYDVDPGAKVVDDVNLQTLLDVFATLGLFAASYTEVPPGSQDVLMVEQAGRRWVWAVSADKRARIAALQRGDQSEQKFAEARAEFLAMHERSMSFHGTGDARPDFKAENARVKGTGGKSGSGR